MSRQIYGIGSMWNQLNVQRPFVVELRKVPPRAPEQPRVSLPLFVDFLS